VVITVRERAQEVGAGIGRSERADLGMAVEVFAHPVADRQRIVPEQGAERVHVIGEHGDFIT
jgi:hypothetical protein